VCVCVCVCAIILLSQAKLCRRVKAKNEGSFSLSLSLFHTNHNEHWVLSFDAFFSHLNITRRRREIEYTTEQKNSNI